MVTPERVLHPDRSARDLFGYRLRKLRKQRGPSPAMLADELRRGKTVIADVETADRPIPLELPDELDRFFQTDGLFAHLFNLSLRQSFPTAPTGPRPDSFGCRAGAVCGLPVGADGVRAVRGRRRARPR
ncbi:helix-turn-helix domain-containing protein [Kitasatospora sp. NPDC090308]|uniref:helix-turn-helix domain-containing protein n=1 Tax=Kitasatospora sp. NPDC090308 TaxID=3364082 RepID=UPI00381C5354